MQFRTQVPITTFDHSLDYRSRIVSLGSCFAVNMAEKFRYFKFQSTINPFGILFHAIALEKFIDHAVSRREFTDADIFYHNDRWHSFDAHSDMSHPDKSVVINRLNFACQETQRELNAATHIIITLGTAWSYRNVASGEIVANCHKVPQKQFLKELQSAAAIKTSLANIVSMLERVKPDVKIIFTISPVRHLKDGFVDNQRSKSHLFTALHELLDVNPHVAYFPSYEIMMDELRDYRFYNDDMIHPSGLAVEFIWNRFAEAFIAADTVAVMREIEAITRGLSHRSFNPGSAQHRQFLQTLDVRISVLQNKYPHITF